MNKCYKQLLVLFAILVIGMGTLLAQGAKDDYLNSYLTIESLADNDTVTLRIPEELTSAQMNWIAYSTDATNWTVLEVNGTLQKDTIILNQGEKVYFKGLGKQCDTVIDNYWHFVYIRGSADHVVYGNIMSLLYGDDFASQTAFPEGSTYAFGYLFHGNEHLVSAENLILPATSLAYGCYYGMFAWWYLLSLPISELPAIELEELCYQYMYYACNSLTTASSLPATTLANQCYLGMFNSCTSLTSAPALPAVDLASHCYQNMFRDCTSLTEAPELPALDLAPSCYVRMFKGCSALATAPVLPATNLATECYYEMFEGCESLTTAPELPATTLADRCYYLMFCNCTSLSAAPEMHAEEVATSCCEFMFYNCTSLTEAPNLLATTLADYCYYCMFLQCTSLTQAPALPATNLATECYGFMFAECYSLTKAPVLPATTMSNGCYIAMFSACVSLTKGPVLPATVLAPECYAGLFQLCSNLQEVICLATDISAQDCTTEWLLEVAPSGTVYKASEMEDWPLNDVSGIPTGWNIANYDGVDEQHNPVLAYPNPVIDKLHITGKDIQSVKVFDMQGRLVHSQECGPTDQMEVDFQGFAKGVYSVSIQSEGRSVNRSVVH